MTDPTEPAPRPLLAWDGECGFCRHFILRLQRMTGDAVEYVPALEVADRFPGVDPAAFAEAVVLRESDGTVRKGAAAVSSVLGRSPGLGWLPGAVRAVPGLLPAGEVAYRFVARHRSAFSRATRMLWGRLDELPGFRVGPWLFLRLLGVVFACAFSSLWVQVHGLIGSRGILPVGEYLDRVHAALGPQAYLRVPTVLWLSSSDAALHAACALGLLAGLLLAAGVLPLPSAFASWALYLSLVHGGQDFLSFQWDALLLEAGLLGVLLAPGTLLPRRAGRAAVGPRLLLWWLLFRLMLLSGGVKLASGDPSWQDLSALPVHYETQPLPTWVAWHVFQLPDWFHGLSVRATLAVELVVPFLIWLPRRLRHFAAVAFAGFMGAIALTGNYGFFNLLTAALCLVLLDDLAFPRVMRDRLAGEGRPAAWRELASLAVAAVVLFLTTVSLSARLGVPTDLPGPLRSFVTATRPLMSFNGYGLFAVMTTSRREIIVEGSRDGRTWTAYAFRHKPGDPARRPRFVAPHLPRLDWQMWFAPLSHWRSPRNAWLARFEDRLLEGSPQVLGLLAADPFGGEPPSHVRTVVHDYRFSDRATRAARGTWWTTRALGRHGPVRSSTRRLAERRIGRPGTFRSDAAVGQNRDSHRGPDRP